MNSPRQLIDSIYYQAPGWIDGTARFEQILRPHINANISILNLGAGAGHGRLHFDRDAKLVIGADPDPAISDNRRLSYKVRALAESLPFRDQSFDLVYLDWVVEHLAAPEQMVAEAWRVLKCGGHLAFRTGNLLHYSYLVSWLSPQWFHLFIAKWLHGRPESHCYPTYYKMNTPWTVNYVLQSAGFEVHDLLLAEPEPAYLHMSRLTLLAGIAYERLVNRFECCRWIRATILGCFRKCC